MSAADRPLSPSFSTMPDPAGVTSDPGALDAAPVARFAPRLPRAMAFLVDIMMALALGLVWRFSVHLQMLPGPLAWRPGANGPWVDGTVLLFALAIFVLRDVPAGASLSKWLLCLRLVDERGRPLGFARRVLQVPASVLPFTWLWPGLQRRWPAGVGIYTPSARGMATRTTLASLAAVGSLLWGIESLRPSIGPRDASRLAEDTVLRDPALARTLGQPLEFELGSIAPRAHEKLRREEARFDLVVRGRHSRQDMSVLARKVEGAWVVDQVVDIEVSALEPSPREAVAAR